MRVQVVVAEVVLVVDMKGFECPMLGLLDCILSGDQVTVCPRTQQPPEGTLLGGSLWYS